MLGITEPHPSRGFYTEAEITRLQTACPYADQKEVQNIRDMAATRRRAFNAKKRREEKERAKEIPQR